MKPGTQPLIFLNTMVDPSSGRPSNWSNAIPLYEYQNQKYAASSKSISNYGLKLRQPVDFRTGEPCDPTEPYAVRLYVYKNRRMVHPEFGTSHEGNGTITSSAYRSRVYAQRRKKKNNFQKASDNTTIESNNANLPSPQKTKKISQKARKNQMSASYNHLADQFKIFFEGQQQTAQAKPKVVTPISFF